MKINDDYSFFFWVLVLIITLKIIWSLITNDQNSLFWFCFINMCILTVGLYFKNDFVIGSILVSSLLISTLIGFDIIGFTFWGELIFGVYPRIFEMDVFDSILTYYHFLLILIPLYILGKKRFIHPQSWVLSSVFFLIILFTSSMLSDSNLNCSCLYRLTFFVIFLLIKRNNNKQAPIRPAFVSLCHIITSSVLTP